MGAPEEAFDMRVRAEETLQVAQPHVFRIRCACSHGRSQRVNNLYMTDLAGFGFESDGLALLQPHDTTPRPREARAMRAAASLVVRNRESPSAFHAFMRGPVRE